MKQKGFTLIELLVVVAIIGILAAVGVVAYNGYTGAAKKNTTKANNKLIVKYLQSEAMKCNLGEDKILDNKFSCSSFSLSGNQGLNLYVVAAKKNLDKIIKNAFNTSPNFQKAYPDSAIGWGTMYKCYPEGHTNYYTQAQGLHSIAISGSKKIYVHSCIESNGTPETTIFNLD